TEALEKLQQKILLVAVLRLVSFVLFLFTGYEWINTSYTMLPAASIMLLVIFIVLVRIALNLKDRKALLEKLRFININETGILNNQPNQFGHAQQFQSGEDFSADLDMFGPGSVFHLLNRTTTWHGT